MNLTTHKICVGIVWSNDLVGRIVRFVYNIIEKRDVLIKTVIICSSRKGMMICLLPQQN